MSSYRKILHGYNIDKFRVVNHQFRQPSYQSKIDTLENEIRLAEESITRMSTDKDTGLITEKAKAKNRSAISEVQQRIDYCTLEIQSLRNHNSKA